MVTTMLVTTILVSHSTDLRDLRDLRTLELRKAVCLTFFAEGGKSAH